MTTLSSLAPSFRSQYAETHYKFKLPWSPLSKPVPEVFIDAPHLCVPGKTPLFYLAVKDADYYPCRVREVSLNIQHNNHNTTLVTEIDKTLNKQLEFISLPLEGFDDPGNYTINARIDLEETKGKLYSILNHNYHGTRRSPLAVWKLTAPLPYPDDWRAGETHCHSSYSSDPVEFGAPLSVLQEAGAQLGLDFVLCTDHSYDFYYDVERYMNPVDPLVKWDAYRKEVEALNVSGKGPLLIAGEEVSCGNHQGRNVHLLVMGHPHFLPGLGDGGRRWFNNGPDKTIQEIVESLSGTPCFAAHPKAGIGALEKLLFRRGEWSSEDTNQNGRAGFVNGLQFWNGNQSLDFSRGRAFWVGELLAGKKILPIGANDAHGDLNFNIGVKIPLISLYQNRNHLFGKVRTLVRSSELSLSGLQKGIRNGEVCCTDGPFLQLVTNDGSGLKVRALSNEDFGPFQKLILFSGERGATRETVEKIWENPGTFSFEESYNTGSKRSYYRAEAWTSSRRLAISSPLFI